VGFFGRLVPYKGLEVLARAMPIVWEQRPEIRLRISGGGDEPFELGDERVQLERRYLPESELGSFFASVSLSVLPYTEASQTGAGSVAIGHGVPIVVSRVGGLPDLALDASYVVSPGDPQALAAAILDHIDDGAAVRGRVLSELGRPRSWESAAAQSLEVYRTLR
jgi:glycosyltransferase involved in cell wall biosynthesis